MMSWADFVQRHAWLQKWVRQLSRYFVVSAVAATVDLGTFSILIALAGDLKTEYLLATALLATAIAFLAGTVVSFFLCLRFVFRLSGHSKTVAAFRTLISGLVGLSANLIVMYVLVDLLAFGTMRLAVFDGLLIARVIALGVGFFVNFVMKKYYAFRDY